MGEIEIARNGQTLEIVIDRPTVRNALDSACHFRLAEIFDEFDRDESLRVAIITGAGQKAFCVGSDLKARMEPGGQDYPPTGFAGLCERFDLYKPVIAAVNGDCIGGGLEVVLACDLAVASAQARFGFPEPRVGLLAAGGLHRLSRQLPAKHAMDIVLRAKLFQAREALDYALINRVVDSPDDALTAAREMAADIIECAPLAILATKEMISRGLDEASLRDAFSAHYPAYERMLASEDAVEGSMAFKEKRKPVWKGN